MHIIVCNDCNTRTTSNIKLEYCPNCSSNNIVWDYELWEEVLSM